MAGALGPSFGRYWTAATISSFGSSVTTVAMPVLVVTVLQASPFEVGVVDAAQFVPYALLGVIAGAYADRLRRKPLLVWASVGRALTLGAIPVLWLVGVLQIWMLVVALLLFGACSVVGFAATQSLLPRLVPRSGLVRANARLDRSDAAAQTVGPGAGGVLIGLVGAPVAILVDAISYLADAVLNASLRVDEPRTGSRGRRLRDDVREGVQWTYRHRTLAPLAASTHVWFLANGAAMTVLSLLTLRTLGWSGTVFALLMATFGIASLIGASAAPWVGGRIGSGRAIIMTRFGYPLAWVLAAVAPATALGYVLLFAALTVQGFSAGVENSNEMGYWQALTPDGLLGRVNAARRSINRTIGAAGALTAGVVVGAVGDRLALVGVIVVFAAAALITAVSPLRSTHDTGQPDAESERAGRPSTVDP